MSPAWTKWLRRFFSLGIFYFVCRANARLWKQAVQAMLLPLGVAGTLQYGSTRRRQFASACMCGNRPQGSFLKRACTCHVSGRQFCLPHRLQPLLRCKGNGERVWSSTSASFLTSVRKLLAALGVDSPERYTLKMFRSGHTTALAAEGKSIGHIPSR